MLIGCPSEKLLSLFWLFGLDWAADGAHCLNLLLRNCLIGLREGVLLSWGKFLYPESILLVVADLGRGGLGVYLWESMSMFLLVGVGVAECEYVGLLLDVLDEFMEGVGTLGLQVLTLLHVPHLLVQFGD